MRINYVTVADDTLASFRYQIATPVQELRKKRHIIIISAQPMDGADTYVFHKHLRLEEQNMAKELRMVKEAKVVFVISDSHFEDKYADHYINMCCIANRVVCATEALAKIVKTFTGVDAEVIFDPWGVEFEEKQPGFKPDGKLKLMWFGQPSNFKGLFDVLPHLIDNEMLIVTSPKVGKIKFDNGEELKTIPYSISNMKKTFEECDAVIIPQDLSDLTKIAKTHNRIVDSFRAGKFVVASPVDAYLDFKDYAYLGDVKEGIEWLKKQNTEEIEKRIAGAQEFIRKTFVPEIIAKQWEKVLC